MEKNLNPLYTLQEAHFLSGKSKDAGWKMLKNGIKKNGLLKTDFRNSRAALKRGEHIAKLRNSGLKHGNSFREISMLQDIGKRAAKGKHLSSKQAKALTLGRIPRWYD